MKKLVVIDTFNFLHRAYHALPKTFKDSNGEPTNAIYGVTSMIITTIDLLKPDYIVAAVDSMEPTFRVEEFTGYKAHRKPMEDDLSSQIPKVFEILDAFGIKTVTVNGYEADDIIGTVASKYSKEFEIVIVSNDRDMWQLTSKNVVVMIPNGSKGVDWIGYKEANARLGFDPKLLPDYKGLRGDPSDNIPGVYGIGDKTARELILEYKSIENVYKNLENIQPDSLKSKLKESYEIAIQSKELGRILLDVPFSLDINECRFNLYNKLKVKEVLEKYNFKSLIRRLGFEDNGKAGADKGEIIPDNQLSLL